MRELDWNGTLSRGRHGSDVRRVQEWLTLSGHALVVDGDFGSATELAVRRFQDANGLSADGKVDRATFAALSQPLKRAAEDATPVGGLGRRVVYYAQRHLKEHAREVGGENCGPWVRTYMNGNEGTEWPWCAGFVFFVLDQACRSLGIPRPIARTFSCDTLAARAQERGLFLKESQVTAGALRPGDLFLNRRSSGDWTHVGIVLQVVGGDGVFQSVEGNTNDRGDREGYEVCRRSRSFGGKDFVTMPAT